MPRLSFPFVPDGLLVPSLIGLAGPAMQSLQAQGAALPGLVQARGVLDSGTTVTAVAPWVLSALNAAPGAATQVRTAAGTVSVHFYQVSFTIYNLVSGGAALTRPDWIVTNLIQDLDDVDVLFGLDLLHEIVQTVDGPRDFFTLDF
jgi:hypothetical protein